MMAAYQPQPGAMQHPGMAQHGHPPMTPGAPMTPAQMQQMGHPGVSGPGAPHVSQASAMMAMQHGANGMGVPGGMGGQMGGVPNQMGGHGIPGMPNAQAMAQMTPQQQMMIQQQMMAAQGNPNLHAQRQNQQMIMQQRQQLQMMQSQGALGHMNPQQLQQMQQNGQGMPIQSVQLPQHLQNQMLLRQQQQQQQAQQAQAQHNQQMQQQLAMQQANSQQSNQGGQPTPQSQQGGQPQQPPMRPQSAMATPGEQGSNQGQHTPQSGGQAQGQQQQQQGQANQQQGQQQNLPQPGQQQGMNPQQLIMMQRHRAIEHHRLQQQQAQQQQAQQQQAQQQQGQQGQQMGMNPAAIQQRMLQQQQQQQQQLVQTSGGHFILRLILLCDELSVANPQIGRDVANWNAVVDKHFAPDGRLAHEFTSDNGDKKTYEVLRPTIGRYFHAYFESGATSIRVQANHAREHPIMGQKCHVSFSSATFTVLYPNGARLEMGGSMNFLFGSGGDGLEYMEIKTMASEEIIGRSKIEELLSSWSPAIENKSPKMTKKPPKAQQKNQSSFDGLTIEHFPKTPKGPFGGPKRVQQFLEIGETMNVMSDLISHSQETRLRPSQALESLVTRYESEQPGQPGNPQINLPVNGINRTPSMGNMQMPNNVPNQFASPGMSNLTAPMMNGSPHIPNHPGLMPNLNLPNSHTPSPHQSNMAAPSMMPQHSQQGTNSSAASANTSPNVNNKRRRSTVKMEGDEAGGEGGPAGGANRVKPSPRMKKQTKPGG